MDLFNDHFLAVGWQSYSVEPLEQFTQSVYASFEALRHELPVEVTELFQKMQSEDWLCSYRETANVRLALDRIGSRLRKPQALGGSLVELERNYGALREDFTEFFPELRPRVQNATVE